MRNDEIFSQGRLADAMFLLSKGQVQISVKDPNHAVASDDGHEQPMNRSPIYASQMHGMVFCDGAFFGELGLLNPDGLRTASVYTRAFTEL